MPRSGSGSASQLPSTAAVSGQPISSIKYNSAIADIYGIFNTEWPVSLLPSPTEQGAQPINANLTSLSTLGTAANKLAYTTGAGTWAETSFPAWARTFLATADITAAKVSLGAQPLDGTLTTLSALALVSGDILYATAADTLGRLPKGTANQTLTMNGGATAPIWATQSLGIGEGQIWQNVSGSRVAGTSYQNTTGRSIMVSVDTDNFVFLQVSTNGTTWITIGSAVSTTCAVVPPAHFYRISGAATIEIWAELR